ncbi:MAG: MotA/TolQ/ExbB proton channel family protein [Candidatus Margulisiibacteriota bacterium]
MDLGTIFGILAGLTLILGSILLGEGGNLALYFDLHGLAIVLGGVIAATLVSYPMDEMIGVFRVVGKAFRTHVKEPSFIMLEMIHLATSAKRLGLLKLPEQAKKLKDPFVSKGIQLIADRVSREEIIRTLETEILLMQARHRLGREIFQQMGKYAPAFGMVGTLIGLVQMMADLEDPDKVGPAMSVALLATFYGAVFANLFCLPIANKLKRRSEREFLNMEIVKEALLSIEAGETITLLQDKLSSFISRSLFQALNSQDKKSSQKQSPVDTE